MSKISKHQKEGKHSLNYDIIFKGKKEKLTEEDDVQITDYQETFQYDPGSRVYDEAYNNDDFERRKRVTDKVYAIIRDKTDVNLDANRRKPSKKDFNEYFVILKKELEGEKFTNVELFNELAVYFSDNLFTIFKLLDNKWRNKIIEELQEHIGNAPKSSTEVSVRNLTEGSEIEFFYYDDIEEEEKLITGVVLEYNKEEEHFKVDSFENIYLVELAAINKILNNRKFKHNLSKLINIDFL